MLSKESEKPAHKRQQAFLSMVGLQKCREFLIDPTIMDHTISQFMSRLNILIMTHSFTCASYNPYWTSHSRRKGPLIILVMIDAFSRWVELFPTKTTGASEAASCVFQHFGRFGTPDVIHIDQG